MTARRRRADPGHPGTRGPLRCAIALWLSLLFGFGLYMLLAKDEPGRGSQLEIVLTDVLEAGIIAVAAWRSWHSIKTLLVSRRGLVSVSTILTVVAGFLAMAGFQWLYWIAANALGFEYDPIADEYAGTGWPLWAVLIDVAIVPAVLEEVALRGVIQAGMESVMPVRDALIVQAAMFSVLHFLPAIFVSHFVMGLILGVVRLRTRSIYPGMIVHGAWNAAVLVVSG